MGGQQGFFLRVPVCSLPRTLSLCAQPHARRTGSTGNPSLLQDGSWQRQTATAPGASASGQANTLHTHTPHTARPATPRPDSNPQDTRTLGLPCPGVPAAVVGVHLSGSSPRPGSCGTGSSSRCPGQGGGSCSHPEAAFDAVLCASLQACVSPQAWCSPGSPKIGSRLHSAPSEMGNGVQGTSRCRDTARLHGDGASAAKAPAQTRGSPGVLSHRSPGGPNGPRCLVRGERAGLEGHPAKLGPPSQSSPPRKCPPGCCSPPSPAPSIPPGGRAQMNLLLQTPGSRGHSRHQTGSPHRTAHQGHAFLCPLTPQHPVREQRPPMGVWSQAHGSASPLRTAARPGRVLRGKC